jgi:hypothetical protein
MAVSPKKPHLWRFIEATLWPRLEQPLADIIVHFVVSFLSVLSIASLELMLHIAGLDGKAIPGTQLMLKWLGANTQITLSDWMIVLEVAAVTVINIVGIYRALTGLARS